MTEDAGMVYSTQQVADMLGIGAAMLRRYAQTLEKVSGEEIRQTRKDGRQFSQWHVDTLQAAKALVDARHGLDIKTALEMTLAHKSDPAALISILPSSGVVSEELVRALQEAVATPIVAELRELRRDHALELANERALNAKLLQALEQFLSEQAERGAQGHEATRQEVEALRFEIRNARWQDERRLHAELGRVRWEEETKEKELQRPWWRWWGRS